MFHIEQNKAGQYCKKKNLKHYEQFLTWLFLHNAIEIFIKNVFIIQVFFLMY